MSKKSEILARQEKALHMREMGRPMEQIAIELNYMYQGEPDVCSAGRAVSLAMTRRAKMKPATRRFGVEIETVGATKDALANAISSVVGYHVPVLGYHGSSCQCCGRSYSSAEKLKIWKVEHDSSLTYQGGNRLTGEIVSPILEGEAGFAQLVEITKAITLVGATSNSTTGLHVHVEASDLSGYDISRVVQFYSDNQSRINNLVSRSRRNTRWAGATSDFDKNRIAEAAQMQKDNLIAYRNKYQAVNISPLFSYGTIEFRQHQGTTNGKKIVTWVKFVQAVITAAQFAIKIDDSLEVAEMIDVMTEKCGLDAPTATALKATPARVNR